MDPITVSVQLTPEDAVLARRLDRSRRTWIGRHGAWLFVLVFLSHFTWIVALLLSSREYYWVILFVAASGMNATIVAYRVWTRIVARRALRREPALLRPFTLEITDFGVQSSSPAPPGTLRWADLKEWAHGELHYLIYPTSGAYYVVPKRFMSDSTALGEVLREKLGPAV